MRHEILNESALFDNVCADVIKWIEEVIWLWKLNDT
jgi:hypothetical protein